MLFYSMAVNREALQENTWGSNMEPKIKDRELIELNWKYLKTLLITSLVTMPILVIDNSIVKNKKVPTIFS